MLTLSNVSKRFGEKHVLHNLCFSVPEHTIYGFVGQNGAGKTTSMKLILGLIPADSGEITVNNTPVIFGCSPANRYIGYLPDVPEFYPYMTPEEYLHFCGELSKMSRQENNRRSEELLELVGLKSEKKRRIRGFSRGMKQRLGIAAALFHRPRLLICDEPTSALDPVGRREILAILSDAGEQTTVLFSSHILSDVERICDKVAFLHQGRIMAEGTPEDLRRSFTDGSAPMEIELVRPEDTGLLLAEFPFLMPVDDSPLKPEEISSQMPADAPSCMPAKAPSSTPWKAPSLKSGNPVCVLRDSGMLPEILEFIAARGLLVRRIEQRELSLEEIFIKIRSC